MTTLFDNIEQPEKYNLAEYVEKIDNRLIEMIKISVPAEYKHANK